jgi:NitT/TauT family transport system ATP-binding protein
LLGANANLIFEAQRAGKVFRGERGAPGTRALEPMDFSVRQGEFVTLIGPSGCGKSTLLRLVAGLASQSEGELRWWGAGRQAIGTQGKRLVFVFQSPTLMPWASVQNNVRLPLDLEGAQRGEGDLAAKEAIAQVGLAGFERHYPREISGGMQMRVSIARALVTRPNLLLLDEPFGALDEITRNRLDGDLLQWWREKGLTIVFVTHSIYEAVFLSTRVVVMSARPGRILRELAIDEPYPRDNAFRSSSRFAAHCETLFDLLGQASANANANAKEGHS